LSEAVRDSRVIISATIFALFIFCIQMILVHLVNYATDIGISSLVAAGFISLVGASSVGGRLAIGAGADRFGLYSTMTFCIVTAIAAMLVLIFVKEVWAFFLFAVIFGFAYGGEVPQIPLFVGRFCGTKAMAALVGLILFVANIGGALGPWVGGKIYDLTSNYQWAFTLGTLSLAAALVLTLVLKKQDR
jgi:MFS family permease